MIAIRPFLPRDTVFNPAVLVSMAEAFDKACAALGCEHEAPIVKEAIAAHIVTLAEDGETDPDQLCKSAVVALGCRVRQ